MVPHEIHSCGGERTQTHKEYFTFLLKCLKESEIQTQSLISQSSESFNTVDGISLGLKGDTRESGLYGLFPPSYLAHHVLSLGYFHSDTSTSGFFFVFLPFCSQAPLVIIAGVLASIY